MTPRGSAFRSLSLRSIRGRWRSGEPARFVVVAGMPNVRIGFTWSCAPLCGVRGGMCMIVCACVCVCVSSSSSSSSISCPVLSHSAAPCVCMWSCARCSASNALYPSRPGRAAAHSQKATHAANPPVSVVSVGEGQQMQHTWRDSRPYSTFFLAAEVEDFEECSERRGRGRYFTLLSGLFITPTRRARHTTVIYIPTTAVSLLCAGTSSSVWHLLAAVFHGGGHPTRRPAA